MKNLLFTLTFVFILLWINFTKADVIFDQNIWNKNVEKSSIVDNKIEDVIANYLDKEDEITSELEEAYNFACLNEITTIKEGIKYANFEWNLTRIAMAKMLSNYAINFMWKVPANIIVPKFDDITPELNEQYNWWVELAYQLWIMWINMKNNKFRPFDSVTRAEFATSLSRLIYWIEDWDDVYYSTHINMLKNWWVITNDNPNLIESRWYVMLMLYRSSLDWNPLDCEWSYWSLPICSENN